MAVIHFLNGALCWGLETCKALGARSDQHAVAVQSLLDLFKDVAPNDVAHSVSRHMKWFGITGTYLKEMSKLEFNSVTYIYIDR